MNGRMCMSRPCSKYLTVPATSSPSRAAGPKSHPAGRVGSRSGRGGCSCELSGAATPARRSRLAGKCPPYRPAGLAPGWTDSHRFDGMRLSGTRSVCPGAESQEPAGPSCRRDRASRQAAGTSHTSLPTPTDRSAAAQTCNHPVLSPGEVPEDEPDVVGVRRRPPHHLPLRQSVARAKQPQLHLIEAVSDERESIHSLSPCLSRAQILDRGRFGSARHDCRQSPTPGSYPCPERSSTRPTASTKPSNSPCSCAVDTFPAHRLEATYPSLSKPMNIVWANSLSFVA